MWLITAFLSAYGDDQATLIWSTKLLSMYTCAQGRTEGGGGKWLGCKCLGGAKSTCGKLQNKYKFCHGRQTKKVQHGTALLAPGVFQSLKHTLCEYRLSSCDYINFESDFFWNHFQFGFNQLFLFSIQIISLNSYRRDKFEVNRAWFWIQIQIWLIIYRIWSKNYIFDRFQQLYQ